MTKKQVSPARFLHWYHWLVVIASLLLTVTAWKISDNQIQAKRAALFKAQSELLLTQISERMSHYEIALKAGAAAVQTYSLQTPASDWKTFSDTLNIFESYPGINGIGIIYHIPKSELDSFLIQQRKTRPNFAIHPQHQEQEYWPITYIEPVEHNMKAVGLDMAFEHNRFSAAKKARDTASTQITAPIVLVQDAKKTPGFLQFIPFYDTSETTSLAQRQTHFVGHVYAPFIMYKLMEGTLQQSNRQLVFSIFDGKDNLYDELTESNHHYDDKPLFSKTITLNMYGRPWTFHIQSALSFRTSTHSSQPLIILGSGILIDALLLFIFITLTRSQNSAMAIANQITHSLAIKEEYYRHIIESAPCGIIITSDEGVIEQINPQTRSLFGYTDDELIGKKVEMLVPSRFQPNHPQHRNSFHKNPSHRQMGIGREIFGMTKSGYEFPAEIGIAQFKDGNDLKVLATIIDMAEHVKITEELKRSNKELNDFAYVASHDLKAPLRGIMQLSCWIEEDIIEFANEETKENLSLLKSRTARLESLLEDLLAYSRVGRKGGEIQLANVHDLVLNIFDLQPSSENISMTCDITLPEINTPIAPLETIFRNLIGNAIKHKGEGKLMIDVSGQEHITHYQFSVADNGVGIDPKYHQQIFELFKTLRPRDDVEGSGMGLSIIKKLLDYHKGEINVISDGVNGTCFTFTWPKIL
ncbi:CHASE domain-containing protein [Pseudoalteromonas sp. MMG012]|uniref:CHASE domain-containing protein n=1 Tax=Pseudoalteromonas sp. MMG012 TaxID=2822686 RepID=UPI001B39D525|nr:CHASE domain-containing protein [Pseudoalteromonas sp. MMG012]MBQ4850833.1 CHASE domain-containing protein [Pseudoalteromonas sp. MMG012]